MPKEKGRQKGNTVRISTTLVGEPRGYHEQDNDRPTGARHRTSTRPWEDSRTPEEFRRRPDSVEEREDLRRPASPGNCQCLSVDGSVVLVYNQLKASLTSSQTERRVRYTRGHGLSRSDFSKHQRLVRFRKTRNQSTRT